MTAARDPDDLKARLNRWIATLPELAAAQVERAVPAEGGASSETWLLDLANGTGWVLRIEPRARQIYEDPSVARQFAVIRALKADPALPVPAALALEEHHAVIGAPFFVMERASGSAPPNDYHTRGVIAEAAPEAREAMAQGSIALLARLHARDPAPLAFLGWHAGGDAIAQELGRWDSYRAWSALPPFPLFDHARDWLERHRPAPQPPGFAWGDARPSNILFAGGKPAALLDWETASLGGAESDLGWWLFYDRMITEEEGAAPLPGWPGAAEVLRLWQAASGREARAMDWHLVFAGYRFALISERARALAIAAGAIPPEARGFANPAVRLLTRLLD